MTPNLCPCQRAHFFGSDRSKHGMLRMLWLLSLMWYMSTHENLQAATVTWSGAGDGSAWTNRANWVGNVLPGAGDDVIIQVLNQDAEIVIPSGNISVRSIQAEESLTLAGGTLTLTAGISQVHGTLVLGNRTTLTVRGASTQLNADGVTRADGADVVVSDGASVALSGLSQYKDTSGCCGSTWVVQGTHSVLQLPGITNIIGNPVSAWQTSFEARSGGHLEFSNLSSLGSGSVRFYGEGTSSLVDLPALVDVSEAAQVALEARTTASVLAPLLTEGSHLSVISRSGGTVQTTQLTSLQSIIADGITLDFSGVTSLHAQGTVQLLNGGQVLLGAVTNADGVSFRSEGGTLLELPGMTQYFDTGGCCGTLFQASGKGSQLSFPNLVIVRGNPVAAWVTEWHALNGGRLEAPKWSQFLSGSFSASSEGSNSWVALPSLIAVTNGSMGLIVRSGGTIDVPNLSNGREVQITVGPNGHLPLTQWTDLQSITSDGTSLAFPSLRRMGYSGLVRLLNKGAIDLSNVTNMDGVSLSLASGTSLLVPNVDRYLDTSGCCGASWDVTGPNTTLSLPHLAHIRGNNTWTAVITASSGGIVDLPVLSDVLDGNLSWVSGGSNSVIRIPSLQSATAPGHTISFTARNFGHIEFPQLTRLNWGNLQLQTGGTFSVTQMTNIDGTSLHVDSGSQMIFNNLQTYADSSRCCGGLFEASGTNTILGFPILNELHGNPVSNWPLTFSATGGGSIIASQVTSLPEGSFQWTADGAGSLVDVRQISLFNAANGRFVVNALNGGVVRMDSLTFLNSGALVLKNGGVFANSVLQHLLNTTISVDGETLKLPVLQDDRGTTWVGTNGGRVEFPAPSDLAVIALDAPTTALSGQPVQLVWTVTNQSNVTATGPRFDSVLLSSDTAVGGDILLSTVSTLDEIAPGATQSVTNLVILPAGISGNRWFMIQVDSGFNVYESPHETNNIWIQSSPTAVSVADLVVDSVTAPSSAVLGQSIALKWTVRNAGSSAAPSPWVDTVYFSTNNTLTADAIRLGSFSAPLVPLGPSSSYTQTQTVALPLNATTLPGKGFILVVVDSSRFQAEVNENNNVRASAALTLTRPPLPDLAITALIVPNAILPGVAFPLIYTVTNAGAADLHTAWEESWFIADDSQPQGRNVGGYTQVIPPLPAGTSLQRTQFVTLSLQGPAGNLRFGVAVDTSNGVVEENEGNNAFLSDHLTTAPQILTLLPGTATFSEKELLPVTLRLSRNGSLEAPLEVALQSGNSQRLSAPARVTFPAHVAEVAFDVQGSSDGVPTGTLTIPIVAQASGFIASTNIIQFLDADVPHLALKAASTSLLEGQQTTITVTREGALSQDLDVQLASSSPGQWYVPGRVRIPANQSSASFSAQAVDDYYIESPHSYQVTASASGYAESTVQVLVTDDDLPQLQVNVSASRVREGDKSGTAVIQITRDRDGVAPLLIQIEHTAEPRLLLPNQIQMRPGELAVSVPISILDDLDSQDDTTLTVEARIQETLSQNPILPGSSTTFTLVDNDGPHFRLEASRSGLCAPGATKPSLTELPVQIHRIGNLQSSVTAALAINSLTPGLIDVPATISFSANQETASITLRALGTPLSSHEHFTLSATAPGYHSGEATWTISADCEPDLVISNLVVAAQGLTDEAFAVAYREVNIGSDFAIVAKPPGITNLYQNLFLSANGTPSEDSFLGAVVFDGAVNPYTFLDRTATFHLPHTPGDYWLLVQADGSNVVSELSEENNFGISTFPIHVDPAYTASVQASPKTAVAGTSITLSGSATRFGSQQPAAFELVSLHLQLRDTERTIAALTDANGRFSTLFTPLPGEAGTYRVSATHPGVSNAPVQDTFTLYGMRTTPGSLVLSAPSFLTLTQHVSVENLGDTPLSGITASAIGAPSFFHVEATAPSALNGFSQGVLELLLRVDAETNLSRTFTIELKSAEGAIGDLSVTLNASSRRPSLVSTPSSLQAGAARGSQQFIAFQVENLGGGASGALQTVLPAIPYLSSVTPMPTPGLAPGGSNTFTLQFSPPSDAPLGVLQGNLLVSDGDASVSIPFQFQVLSTNHGALRVEVTDQFTYYAEGAPRVTNAIVQLRDPYSGSLIASQTNNLQGIAVFPDLAEGYYTLQVIAEDHAPYRSSLLVGAGNETQQEALLNREVVQFIWNVVPTEIGDHTRITIESVFETVVPVPVITVEPSVIDLSNFPQGGTLNLTITNHGLLAAQQTRIGFSEFDCWKITPLITDIGTLAARSSIVIPVTICHDASCSRSFQACSPGGLVAGPSPAPSEASRISVEEMWARVRPAPSGGGAGCGGGAITFLVPCGSGSVGGGAPVGVSNAGGNCGGIIHAGGSGAGGSFQVGGASGFGGTPCDPCGAEVAKAVAKCGLTFLIPLGLDKIENCVFDSGKCLYGLIEDGVTVGTALNCLGAVVSCAEATGKEIPYLGNILNAIGCLDDLMSTCGGSGLAGALGFGGGGSKPPPQFQHPYPGMAEVGVAGEHAIALLTAFSHYFGNPDFIRATTSTNFPSWLTTLRTGIDSHGDSAEVISSQEAQRLTQHPLTNDLTVTALQTFIDRWNRTVSYYQKGIYYSTNVPPGQSTDFIAIDTTANDFGAASQAVTEAHSLGYTSISDEINGSVQRLKSIVYQPQNGTCAHVRLKLDQDAVIARDAFQATLEIVNQSSSPLTAFAVDLSVYRSDGSVATSLFGISAPSMNGIGAVDGTGKVDAGTTAAIAWNLLPTVDAAPNGPEIYQVGGTLRYIQDGVTVTVPLALAPITVHPLAQLRLSYFHQRDVLGDDPFTDVIEPSVPYSLAVLVRNTGNGTAKRLKITSSQPKIVDNEKGLFIDFQILATQVAGKNLVPSLTADFGDVAPGSVQLAQWLFRSSLQGLFIDYAASFEHIDDLGDPRLSLIQSVDIHELIRMVQAPGTFEDGLPDMLVNDVADFEDLPDTLYLSDGRIEPVTIVQTGTIDGTLSAGNLQVTLKSPLPQGWCYLRLLDPSAGKWKLASVVRGDGTSLSVGTNAWTSDRTFVGGGHRPVLENRLHLLDFNSTGVYTLTYEPLPSADTTAPISHIQSLPTVSSERIPLLWSGEDETNGSGIAYYDLFVSVNRGPFAPWLQKTKDTSATYEGTRGNTYAFYSLATDRAGNRQSSPFSPDAITSVDLTNTPPILISTNVIVMEGEVLNAFVTAVDPDVPPQSLTYTLLSTAPNGLTLNPSSGLLTWRTTEATGPSTQTLSIRVTDSGFPSYASTGIVTILVLESNLAPSLAAQPDRTIREGQFLSFTNTAIDPDLPVNRLTYRLGANAPAGAFLQPETGVFSWRPNEVQGGKTYRFDVVVSDDGVPSLSATQQVQITVRDTLADFELSSGSTYLLTGESNAVPLSLKSGLELTKLSFLVHASKPGLGSFGLIHLAPEIRSASLVEHDSNTLQIGLDLDAAASVAGTRKLLDLAFKALPGAASAIVALDFEQVSAVRVDGVAVPNAVTHAGRIFLIGEQPLLDVEAKSDRQLTLWLYAPIQKTYLIERTSPVSGAPWNLEWSAIQTNLAQPFNIGTPTSDQRYWRARVQP